ncbi:MAG TPA: hypothetical protein VFL83_10695 [Anaeromyxobacter sp.]|nr:hypothetical protein [Anaeromyxobacter sp.]
MIAALVAALLASASPSDTVYTADGGRITGTVLEESPTAGVTIQMPDGTVRRLERSQVSRIEFADGTVSTVRPPAPPPAPAQQAAPVARPTVEGPLDSVYFRGGGRARGTVMEENAATGVKVRLLDGSIHTYSIEEVVRIEYADGTVSTPRAAPPPPVAEAAPARAKTATEAPADNVYFLGGGRVRGTVIEENPRTGVKIRLLDGSIHTYSRDELVRIEYADGSVSRRVTPAPAAPAAAPAPPPPVAAPPVAAPAAAPPPARPAEKPQAFPLYLSLGVGATFLGGDAEKAVPMSSVFATEQAHVSSELALRFSPSFAFGVYGDVSGGEPAAATRDSCDAQGYDCVATTGHFGFLVRHTWDPLTKRPKWLSLGTGWEFGSVSVDRHDTAGPTELFSYTGREYVRVGAGLDFRSNDVIALGIYGSFAVGEYDEYKTSQAATPENTSTRSTDRATHTTAQVGLRLTLFP